MNLFSLKNSLFKLLRIEYDCQLSIVVYSNNPGKELFVRLFTTVNETWLLFKSGHEHFAVLKQVPCEVCTQQVAR